MGLKRVSSFVCDDELMRSMYKTGKSKGVAQDLGIKCAEMKAKTPQPEDDKLCTTNSNPRNQGPLHERRDQNCFAPVPPANNNQALKWGKGTAKR